jgi:cytochrome oxidase Cu insertion factor (SCO1/SenC/PrrC family)
MKKRTIVLLVLLFIFPVAASFMLYATGWRPSGTINHGELVQPARPIKDVSLTQLDGKQMRFADLHKKWTLIYFGSAECLNPCKGNLYKMRQVRLSLGGEGTRVQRLFVVTNPNALGLLKYELKEYPNMAVVTGPAKNIEALASQFDLPVGTPLDNLDRIYVVDPLGLLMMSYPADADPSGMRNDLKRLLKVSRIG